MKIISDYIKSPINYVGGKYKLISQIEPLFPRKINTFIDVFGGSGTVLINTQAEHYIYNDINYYVTSIFNGIISQSAEDTISQVEAIIKEYDLSKTNKAGFEKLRDDYNNGRSDWITLYTLMCHSFNWQMRFNNNHQYNSSWGKDRSSFTNRQKDGLIAMKNKIGTDIVVMSKSFNDIDFSDFDENDLVYLDPPYYNSVGSYNDGKRGFEGWTKEHEIKLLDLMTRLHKQGTRFALSNNLKYDNPYLREWLDDNNFYTIHYLKGDYVNCNYHKIDRSKDAEVLITNY